MRLNESQIKLWDAYREALKGNNPDEINMTPFIQKGGVSQTTLLLPDGNQINEQKSVGLPRMGIKEVTLKVRKKNDYTKFSV